MSNRIEVGIAAFVVDPDGVRHREVQPARRMRAASVVKPLLFWAGAGMDPFTSERQEWNALARPSVVVSDNDTTAELWSRLGGHQLLAVIAARAGVTWRSDDGGEHPALRLLTTATELASAYAAFAADDDEIAVQLRAWMCEVPAAQSFGVREVARDVLDVPDATIAVKCGWFALERAHAVTIIGLGDRTLGAAVMTFRAQDEESRAAYAAANGDDARVVAEHDRFAGDVIRIATRNALRVAAAL